MIHAAASYSLAVLENLVHWNTSRLPDSLVCVVATIPATVSQSTATIKKTDNVSRCRKVGNQWYDEAGSAVLWVPSVVSPFEKNVLINQMHPDFAKIKVQKPVAAKIDSRVFRDV